MVSSEVFKGGSGLRLNDDTDITLLKAGQCLMFDLAQPRTGSSGRGGGFFGPITLFFTTVC